MNKKLLTLTTVYNSLKLGQIMNSHLKLIEIKQDLEGYASLMRVELDTFKEVHFIEKQIEFVTYNINVLEKAILCHESNVYQRLKTKVDTLFIPLN